VPESPYTFVLDVSGTLTSSETTILGGGNFDLGGEGVGFHDADDLNGLNDYRAKLGDFESAAMDITESGGSIGWSNSGEWVQYTVDVAEADYYEIDWYITAGGDSYCHVEVDGSVVGDIYTVVSNNSWIDWRYYCEQNGVVPPYLYLTEGKHTVRFVWDAGNLNFNGLRLKSIDPSRIVYKYPKGGLSVVAWSTAYTGSGNDAGGVASLFDNNYGQPSWHSGYGGSYGASFPYWFIVDLGSPKTISKIATHFTNTNRTARMECYISNSNSISTQGSDNSAIPNSEACAAWGTKISESEEWNGAIGTVNMLSNAAEGQYLLLYLYEPGPNDNDYHTNIFEIDVYGYGY
jgi:hypothetical protein